MLNVLCERTNAHAALQIWTQMHARANFSSGMRKHTLAHQHVKTEKWKKAQKRQYWCRTETVLSVLRLAQLSAGVSANGSKGFSPNVAQQTSVRKKAPDRPK